MVLFLCSSDVHVWSISRISSVFSLVSLQFPRDPQFYPTKFAKRLPYACDVLCYTSQKVPIAFSCTVYFFGLGTTVLGVLPTVAPVCTGASGIGTSLKSSWPMALRV